MTSTTQREELDSVVIRFAGDSGDGMQLTGQQFSTATALMGNDLSTFPDFPARFALRPARCTASPASRCTSPTTTS
jgi:hypothetical protein